MDPTRQTKDDTEANRVIEYYKKYCQNPDLIKYFTGPEASFVGKRTNFELRKDDKVPQHVSTSSKVEDESNAHGNCIIETSCTSQEIMQSPTSLDIEINQIVELEEVEEKNNSPTSSVESNKIEWDNGADIGYSNSYKLSAKKSASFPSLFTSNTSVKCNVLPTVIQEKSITENIKELRKMYNQLTFSSDTSTSGNKEYDSSAASKVLSNDSSSSLQDHQKVKSSTQSSSSDNYLRKKIGYPIAYSTPHEASSSKESYSRSLLPHGGESSKESTSKSSTKHDGYTVTPMLTLPIAKRILNNDIPLNLSEEPSKEVSDDGGNDENSLSQNVMRQKLVQKVDKFNKKINLCLTKPISVECISHESKKSVHKVVQTSFSSDKSSKCVQTEESQLEIMASEPVMVCTPLTQKIEYVRFSSENSRNESDQSIASSEKSKEPVAKSSINIKRNSTCDLKSLRTSEDVNLQGKNCKTTQTDLVMSKKIVKDRKTRHTKEPVDNRRKEIGKSSRTRNFTTYVDSTEVSGSLNSSSFTSDGKSSTSGNIGSTEFACKTADTVNESQTEELLLTEMISLNHSKDLNTDIKRSIDILQKLLKSRKYDEATKKHYIKKIVQKIVDSKYSDDSTNSDLFRPKKTSNGKKFEDKNEYQTQNYKGRSKLMDNKPWYPISEPIYTIPKTMTKNSKPTKKNANLVDSNDIRNKTFRIPLQKEIPKTQVNLAKLTSVPLDKIPTAKSSTSKQIMRQNFTQKVTETENNENATKGTLKCTSTASSRLAFSSSLDKENRPSSSDGKLMNANWKTDKTLSEKLLENRDNIDFRKGQGDYLLNVVKNERHHQLSWINNEIEHLVKLKELLEKKPKSRQPDSQLKDVIASLLQMKVGDMKVQSSSLQESQHRKHSRDKSNKSEDLQTHDEAPSISSANPTPTHTDDPQPNIQVYVCSAENPTNAGQNSSERNKQCGCSLESCKCSQTTTHEEKDVQCPAFRQCTSQTEPKEDANVQCDCKAHTGMTCDCDEINQDKENQCTCKKTSSSSSNSNSSSDTSYLSCICCKKKKTLKRLIDNVPLCEPCQEVNQKNFYPHNYSNPLHSCICYNLVNRDILYQFKQTLTELERLDIYQQYCEVLKNCKCCKECGCKCKLPKKFKNGCAYFLKLEDACPNTHCEGEGTNSDFSSEEEDGGENYLPEVTVKVPNCKGSCERQKKNGRGTKKYKSCPSIQNYLCTMKPDFVERAERRRRILKNATSQREQNSDNRKLKFIEKISYLNQRNEKFSSETDILRPGGYQTKAYCVFDIELNESPKKVQPRIFKSFKEMKDLTRRKYLHLSEVRNKKIVHREKRLREANRLLANTFTRRLQRSTLRGAVDIPLNVKVVSY